MLNHKEMTNIDMTQYQVADVTVKVLKRTISIELISSIDGSSAIVSFVDFLCAKYLCNPNYDYELELVHKFTSNKIEGVELKKALHNEGWDFRNPAGELENPESAIKTDLFSTFQLTIIGKGPFFYS